MNFKVAVIKGDGIGPEIVTEAQKVLNKAGEKFGFSLDYEDVLMGGCSIDATGEQTMQLQYARQVMQCF